MKRHLLIIAICLLLGAVANVAVAWGCAVLELPRRLLHAWPNHEEGFTRNGPIFNDWMVYRNAAVGIVRVESHWLTAGSKFEGVEPVSKAEDILPAWAGFARPTAGYPPNTVVFRSVEARGWPLVSLWSASESTGFPGPAALIGNVVEITNGYLIPAEKTKPYTYVANLRVLPLRPIWAHFAVNTLFYAAILWLLIRGPFVLRRFVRVNRLSSTQSVRIRWGSRRSVRSAAKPYRGTLWPSHALSARRSSRS